MVIICYNYKKRMERCGMAFVNKELVKSKLLPFFSAKREITFAYLFGSVAKGNAGTLSDIDIAVFIDPMYLPRDIGYGYKSELIVELQAVLAGKVDLVILNSASTMLKFQILKNGALICCRSEDERRMFHEKAILKYLDIKPLLKIQGHYLRKRLAKGSFGGGGVG
jgi:predicted nucleotidyltransferase